VSQTLAQQIQAMKLLKVHKVTVPFNSSHSGQELQMEVVCVPATFIIILWPSLAFILCDSVL
jgi:hypothetical protein